MNSLKNVMIIAVLAAVGYGVYVSLSRNNADLSQPWGMSEGWTDGLKVELPTTKSSAPLGGPLAISGPNEQANAPRPGAPPTNTPPAQASPPTLSPTESSSPPTVQPARPPADVAPQTSTPPSVALGPPVTPERTLLGGTNQPSTSVPPAGNTSPYPDSSPSNPVRNLAPPPEYPSTSSPDVPAAPHGQASPPASSSQDEVLKSKFAAFMEAVQKKLDEGKLAEAHLALSSLYGNPDLPPEMACQITDLLDQLAGTVIYSRGHYLEPAYFSQPGETLEQIAQRYNVPWQLLAKINGLMPPDAPCTEESAKTRLLPPGTELKVVRGPFDAIINLEQRTLTLMLQGRYAGRFRISLGRDVPSMEGEYTVNNKVLGPTYYGPDGVTLEPFDPRNPLGEAWIGLSDRLGIHGAANQQNLDTDPRGTIHVGRRDLHDLYGILSVGSRVTIMR